MQIRNNFHWTYAMRLTFYLFSRTEKWLNGKKALAWCTALHLYHSCNKHHPKNGQIIKSRKSVWQNNSWNLYSNKYRKRFNDHHFPIDSPFKSDCTKAYRTYSYFNSRTPSTFSRPGLRSSKECFALQFTCLSLVNNIYYFVQPPHSHPETSCLHLHSSNNQFFSVL